MLCPGGKNRKDLVNSPVSNRSVLPVSSLPRGSYPAPPSEWPLAELRSLLCGLASERLSDLQTF